MSTKATKARTKRGPVYRCTDCDYRGDKGMMTSHRVRLHLEDDDVPFCCRLCGFRSNKVDVMKRHMKDRHKGQSLHANLTGTLEPYTLKKSDATTLSTEEALSFYEGRQQRARPTSTESLVRTATANSSTEETVFDKIVKIPLPDVYDVEPLMDIFAPEEVCTLINTTLVQTKQAPAKKKKIKQEEQSEISESMETVEVNSFTLEHIAAFIESTVRCTADAVASANVVAARKQPLPPEQDLRPLTNQLVLTNSHLGEVATQLAGLNAKQSETCEILSSLNKTLSTFGTKTSRLNRGVSTITTTAEKIDANLAAQSQTLKALVQGNIDSNAVIGTALQRQTESLNAVISKANKALKPTTGPISNMVQNILNLEKEKPEEKPAATFKIPMKSVVKSKAKFIAASPRRPEFVEQMKAIRKRRLLASKPKATECKKAREL